MFSEKLFKNQRGSSRVDIASAPGLGLDAGVALVHLMEGQAKTALELTAETPRAQGDLVLGAIGMEGHADDQALGLPFLDQLVDGLKACFAVHRDAAQRLRMAGKAAAIGNADALGAKVKGQKRHA